MIPVSVVGSQAGQSRRVCWVVQQSGQRLGAVLETLGVPPGATVEDGRVFVAGSRARDPAQRLMAGDLVELFGARVDTEPARVLSRRAGLVAAYKPAGMPTEPDRTGRASSLLTALGVELGVAAERLHALGRLDVGVSGVVLVATTRAARLAALQARAEGRLERRYVALAPRAPEPECGVWEGRLTRPADRHRRGRQDERPASTAYACVAVSRVGEDSAKLRWPGAPPVLVAFELRTGRTHQLRLQAMGAGVPLVGDRAHGGPSSLVEPTGTVVELDRIALHSLRLRLRERPERTWEVLAPVPPDLRDWWRKLGGDDAAWSASLRIEP